MAKGGGKAKSEDWACCEQCSYCFTLFVGVLFFLAGAAMAIYAALSFWSTYDVSVQGLELLNIELIVYAIFVVGLAIAGTALLGMVSAGCAKCAANPDGKNDCCERCCTAILSILYIIILCVLLAATLAIAGGLSYYAVVLGDGTGGTDCPYAASAANANFTAGNTVDAALCPLDSLLHIAFYPPSGVMDPAAALTWVVVQNASSTCGYYCGGPGTSSENYMFCDPNDATFSVQTTGGPCFEAPTAANKPETTIFTGKDQDGNDQVYSTAGPVTMPYRPTFYSVLNQILIPFLAVWWCIFVFAILLIVAACVMCIRKKKTTKESTYKPGK